MKRLISTLALLIIFAHPLFSQVTFQIGGGAGYSTASGDLSKEINFMNDSGYGMNNGFNLHAKARAGLLSFVAVGEVGYTMMSADGSVGSVKYENKLNVLSLKVGPEFHLSLPLIPINPYFGANFQVNTFTGESKISGMPGIASDTYDMESATRYGIGINGGVIFSLGGLKLDLNIGYNLLNAFGKEFENNPSSNNFYLDDGEVGNRDARSINTVEFKATIMFGL